MTLAEEKPELRRRMRQLRSAVPEAERLRRSGVAAVLLMSTPEAERAETAFVFHSFGSEISTAPVIEELSARGVRLALPVLIDGALAAAAYRPGDPLVASGYGALEPRERGTIEPSAFDLIVVPGLAFDPAGHRLGYGGGYYDGYLPRTRPDAVRLGFGFELQVVPEVPHDARDERLDAVVTEDRVIRTARA